MSNQSPRGMLSPRSEGRPPGTVSGGALCSTWFVYVRNGIHGVADVKGASTEQWLAENPGAEVLDPYDNPASAYASLSGFIGAKANNQAREIEQLRAEVAQTKKYLEWERKLSATTRVRLMEALKELGVATSEYWCEYELTTAVVAVMRSTKP